jgi:hypothetical protein
MAKQTERFCARQPLQLFPPDSMQQLARHRIPRMIPHESKCASSMRNEVIKKESCSSHRVPD